ncbi:DUF928 domain-containing protein [Iningainema tapete]|nr:DUF928 domain-containing protein [Iningainema tapete]
MAQSVDPPNPPLQGGQTRIFNPPLQGGLGGISTRQQTRIFNPPSQGGLGGSKVAVRLVMPSPPPGRPPGGRLRGGAKRGMCPVAAPMMTALVPFTQPSPGVVNVWGLTTVERPTLWVYVPYIKGSASTAEFVLQDDEDANPIYQTNIALPDAPGVIGISLPASAPGLKVGKPYRWFVNVYCDPQKPDSLIYVEGMIQRVNQSQAIAQQLKSAQPKQQVDIYAQNGLWYDAITTLAQLRQKNPQDGTLVAEWKDLLDSVGLSDVAAKPLVR